MEAEEEQENGLLQFLNEMESQLEKENSKTEKKRKKVNKDENSGKKSKEFFDIETVLNNWLQKVLYVESQLKSSKSLLSQLDESLERMKLDVFLTDIEYDELKYIGKLWEELIRMVHLGTKDNKRRILENLLTLFSLNQISREMFINTCLQL